MALQPRPPVLQPSLVRPAEMPALNARMMQYEANLQQITKGRVLQPLDSSSIWETMPTYYRGWDEIDSKYTNRRVVTVESGMTAQALNELSGLSLIGAVTNILITHERNWQISHRERIMDGMTKLSPTGIPRSSRYAEWAEQGIIERFGHHHVCSVEKLSDPNFGPPALLDMLADFRAQFNHQAILEVSQSIASRPHINALNKADRAGREYSQLQRFNDATSHFGLANVEPNMFTQKMNETMTREPSCNTLIVPDKHQAVFKEIQLDTRAFPARIRDETGVSRDFGEELASLMSRPVTRIQSIGSPGEDNILVTMPTLHAHSDEPQQFGYNPSRKGLMLSSAYEFPPIDYATQEMDRRRMATTVLEMNGSNSVFRRIMFGDAWMRTTGAWMFESNQPGAGPSAAFARLVAEWQDKEDMGRYYRDHIQDAVSRDEPSPASKQKAANATRLDQIKGFREFPWMLHFRMAPNPDGTGWEFMDNDRISDSIAFVRHLGQFREDVLPSSYLHEIVQSMLRDVGRRGGNRQEAMAAVVSEVTGVSFDRVAAALRAAPPADYRWTTPDGADASSLAARQLAFLSRTVAVPLGLIPRGVEVEPVDPRPAGAGGRRQQVRDAQAQAQQQQQQRPGAPVHPADFKAEIMSAISDDNYDAFLPVATLLEHASTLESHKAMATTIKNRIIELSNANLSDSGVLALTQRGMLERLAKLGFSASTPTDAPLPAVNQRALKEFTTFVVPDAEALPVQTRQLPSFTKATTARQSTVESISGGLSAVSLGAGVRDFPVLQDGEWLTSHFPLDYTRFEELPAILEGASSEETWVLMALMALRFDVPTVNRLANRGIKLFNASVERVAQGLSTGSAFGLRRGESFDFAMQPLSTHVTSAGVVGITDFVIKTAMGPFWRQPYQVREFGSVFFSHVLGGWNAQLMPNFETFKSYVEGNGRTDAGDRVTQDCFLNVYPITENHRNYPNNWLGGEVMTPEELYGRQMEQLFHCNSGHSVLQQLLGKTLVDRIHSDYNELMAEDWPGFELPVQMIMHRGANYWPSMDGLKFDQQHPGTGPMGPMFMNNPHECGAIYNGSGKRFSAAAPDSITVAT